MERPLPRGHGSQVGAVGIDPVPVELAAADIDVDVARAQPTLAFPREPDEPEEDDDGEGEVRLEEARGVVVAASWRADCDVELLCVVVWSAVFPLKISNMTARHTLFSLSLLFR